MIWTRGHPLQLNTIVLQEWYLGYLTEEQLFLAQKLLTVIDTLPGSLFTYKKRQFVTTEGCPHPLAALTMYTCFAVLPF
jgi:hypothetical protein